MKAESLTKRIKMKELMDMYSNTIDLEIFLPRRAPPLHKQLNNLYMQNIGFQSQNRKLKEELQHFKDELTQRNLNVMVQDAIERDEPVIMKNTPTVKKSIHPKEKHVVMIEGSSSATRSARLMK